MRRTPLATVAGALAVSLALVACGSSDDDDTSSADTSNPADDTTDATDTTGPDDTSASDDTSGPDDSVVDMTLVPATTVPVPDVEIPESIPAELVVTEITPGEGPAAAVGDIVFVNYVGVRSEDGEQFDTNFGAPPFPVTLGAGGVIPGWDQGLVGVTSGERLQLDIPNELAYGDQPQGDIIQAGDALSFVIDVLAVVPPSDPAGAPTTEELPLSSELVEEPAVEDLVVGDGATLEAGMTGVFQLVAARGDDGEVLESTWDAGQPQALVVAEGQLLDGLAEGLPGMQVGGRRVVTIPSNPDMGLTPETNVIIVADLLAAF